jgi:hypothetical protein
MWVFTHLGIFLIIAKSAPRVHPLGEWFHVVLLGFECVNVSMCTLTTSLGVPIRLAQLRWEKDCVS